MVRRSGKRPRRRSRLRRAFAWFERGILGVMMTVVALVVERRLLKAVKEGGSSKKALEKAERDAEREQAIEAHPSGAAVGLGPEPPGNGAQPPPAGPR